MCADFTPPRDLPDYLRRSAAFPRPRDSAQALATAEFGSVLPDIVAQPPFRRTCSGPMHKSPSSFRSGSPRHQRLVGTSQRIPQVSTMNGRIREIKDLSEDSVAREGFQPPRDGMKVQHRHQSPIPRSKLCRSMRGSRMQRSTTTANDLIEFGGPHRRTYRHPLCNVCFGRRFYRRQKRPELPTGNPSPLLIEDRNKQGGLMISARKRNLMVLFRNEVRREAFGPL